MQDTAATSIVKQVKARQRTDDTTPSKNSIADRVKAQRCDEIHTVVDMDTGELLEYCNLLHHPKFKEVWNISAANELGGLAQGIKGHITPTNTIQFIQKSKIPADRWKDVT